MPSKAPSVAPVGLTAKLREWMGYFRNHIARNRRAGQEVVALEADLEEYDRELRRHSGISLAEARVWRSASAPAPPTATFPKGLRTRPSGCRSVDLLLGFGQRPDTDANVILSRLTR